MMASIGAYLVGVVTAAMICAVATSLFPGKETIRILCGMVMILVLTAPLTELKGEPIWDLAEDYLEKGRETAGEGETAARQTLCDGIKRRTEEYILDKATKMGAHLQVDVWVSSEGMPVPVGVTIFGDVAPYARLRLQKMLSEDLGIDEKEQLWIGTN